MAKVSIHVQSFEQGDLRIEVGDHGIMPDSVRDVADQLDKAVALVRGAYQISGRKS